MSKIYFYKLVTDNGGAPCVRGQFLSLAICKPQIRKSAQEGDWIFGFAANSLSKDNRLIYLAEITKKLRDGDYYKSKKYFQRADCVYRFSNSRFVWKSGSKYHSSSDLRHDLGSYPDYARANVLLSNRFRYFGAAGTSKYKQRFPLVAQAIKQLGRGSRVHHDDRLRDQLSKMARWIWKTSGPLSVKPTSPPSRKPKLRGASCGVGSCWR